MGSVRLPQRGIGAHRGGAATHPENTLAAFRHAVALGAHQIEFDVRRTADGEIVVIHDASVDRTTDGKGLVDELAFDAIRELDAGRHVAPEFRGERVPTLDEVLEVLPRDLWINVQLKPREGVVAPVVERIRHHDRLHQAFLACKSAAGKEARALARKVQLCSLSRREDRQTYIKYAKKKRADFIQFHNARGLPTPSETAAAKRAGFRVNYFCAPRTEHESGALEHLFALGVDFAIVDDVDAALAVSDALGIPRTRGSQ